MVGSPRLLLQWFCIGPYLFKEMLLIRLNKVAAPEFVQKDGWAKLHCDYDLEGDSLYSIKWYKEQHEFFRYLPNEMPSAQAFNLPEVTVDVVSSGRYQVVLKNVSLESAGRYRCEVSTEAPSFSTVIGSVDLAVLAIPRQPPVISGLQDSYRLGDTVRLNCTSARSKPAASLTWYINSVKAGKDALIEYVPVVVKGGLEVSKLGVHFLISKRHQNNAARFLELKCTSTVAKTYAETTERIYLKSTRPSADKSKLTQGSGAGKTLDAFLVSSGILLLAFSR